jgi:hypothetical protein
VGHLPGRLRCSLELAREILVRFSGGDGEVPHPPLRVGRGVCRLRQGPVHGTAPAYGSPTATRAAAGVLTRTLAADLRHRGITVAAVALEAGRPCDPDRIADVVALLAGRRGRTLTGHVLRL